MNRRLFPQIRKIDNQSDIHTRFSISVWHLFYLLAGKSQWKNKGRNVNVKQQCIQTDCHMINIYWLFTGFTKYVFSYLVQPFYHKLVNPLIWRNDFIEIGLHEWFIPVPDATLNYLKKCF
jgi:hypothetical protein